MREKATEPIVGCGGVPAAVGCGDPDVDDSGLCGWHRHRQQHIRLGLEMFAEAERVLGCVERDGVVSVIERRGDKVCARFECLTNLAVSRVMRGGAAARQRRVVSEAVMRSAKMRRLIRSQPRRGGGTAPKWLTDAGGMSRRLPVLAVAVAMAVPAVPERPLRVAAVAAAIRELRLVRDIYDWCDAETLNAMVETVNARTAA